MLFKILHVIHDNFVAWASLPTEFRKHPCLKIDRIFKLQIFL
jgi:hypothetical protein